MIRQKPCKHPGCKNLTTGVYCDIHKKELTRGTTTKFAHMYNGTWKKRRVEYLTRPENFYCRKCGNPATEVDHITPHEGDWSLFWDESNWQPLCKRCHSQKTMRENNSKRGNCFG